ncbi:MAG: DsbA family protein [Anaerolineae bacterium]
MPSKRRNVKRRSRRQSARKRSGLSTYALIAGVVVVAVVVVALIVVLDQGTDSSQAGSDAVALEKSYGADDAPVVVVEYADFQCPYCKQFAEGAEQQLKEDYADKGQVRFVFRHLAFIGDESTWAAEASECANEQDRFWDYHDKLFEEQAGENQGAFSQENLKRFATELGLDSEQFDECLDSGKYESQVRDESREAQRRRISSTPSILVDGQLIQNGYNYQVLQAAVEAALTSP